MLNFEGVIKGIAAHVLYKKVNIGGNRFLYAFKDSKCASAEEVSYIERVKKRIMFESNKYAKKHEVFGVIVFESDLDLPPETIYQCYDDRCLLELVFKRYKSDECLDKTCVQDDFSVIGAEFINFISTLATCRIIRKATLAGLLAHLSYGELMEDLSSAWRMVDAPTLAKSDDAYWVHTLSMVLDELERLEISKPALLPKSSLDKKPSKNKEKSQKKEV
ncbi:MAG: hypothetical protein LBU04_02805 [Christensenellaceae bacterium]|jgi:hypothetical protein|nr:hypothetical protein [Christensenellaceae bacterium]